MRRVALVLLLWASATAFAHPPVGIAPRTPTTTPKSQATTSTLVTSWLDDARARLAADKLDGWLLADWQGENPVAVDVAKPRGPLHRWFYLITAAGEPPLLCHTDAAAAFTARNPPL